MECRNLRIEEDHTDVASTYMLHLVKESGVRNFGYEEKDLER